MAKIGNFVPKLGVFSGKLTKFIFSMHVKVKMYGFSFYNVYFLVIKKGESLKRLSLAFCLTDR
jgi:hypothetical protein